MYLTVSLHVGCLSRVAGIHLFFPSLYLREQFRNLCSSRRQSLVSHIFF